MRRILSLIIILSLAASIAFPVSFDNGSSIEIRDGLFSSGEELLGYSWKTELTEKETEAYDSIRIYLVTGGPGDAVWEYFGHAAFLAEIPKGTSVMFDYGIFSFDRDFYKNFALGRLYYRMMESYAAPRFSSLEDADRDTYVLELALTPLEKCNLLSFLEYNNRPENSVYLYDYYYDNCATRLRDSYNAMTGGRFRDWAESVNTGMTLRDYTKRYLSRSFPACWAISYLLGYRADKDITLWDAMFLPDILRESIEEFQQSESILLYKSETRKPVSENGFFFLKSLMLSFSIVLICMLTYSERKALRATGDAILAALYTLLFAMSAVLLFLETSSIHRITYFNTSVLVISPVTALFAAMHLLNIRSGKQSSRIRRLSRAMLYATSAMLIAKLLLSGFFRTANWEYYLTMIPLYAAESHILIKQRKKA